MNNNKIDKSSLPSFVTDYISSLPEINLFENKFRRYTNFSISSVEEYFYGNLNFGETITCTLNKIGDLVSKIYLKIVLPKINIYKTNTDTNTNINIINYLNNNLIQIEDNYNISK
jgi:hypothetical protein